MIRNGELIALKNVPVDSIGDWHAWVLEEVRTGARISALFVYTVGPRHKLCAVLSHDGEKRLAVRATEVLNEYPSLTPLCPQAHEFEREIAEKYGIIPLGHPWLKPVRARADTHSFYSMKGDEVHEVAVGPVHAGVIEPGHFRFQCHGERVFHLEIALGYQHRGIEKALEKGPDRRTLHWMETLAGDTTVGHAWAYGQALEALMGDAGGTTPPRRAQALRAIMLELERLANHVGDLGALAGDVGYLPTASFCGRLRGDFLNMTALICGNRFGRGMVIPGGVRFDVDRELVLELEKRLKAAYSDVENAAELLFETPSVLARFEGTGVITKHVAAELGLVGPVARAAGLERDVRQDHPTGFYREIQISSVGCHSGDVFGRAWTRWLEIRESYKFILEQLIILQPGEIGTYARAPLRPDSLVVSLIEGWRGEICHVAVTDGQGKFLTYKVVDPSFHNWHGLAMALREMQISDFPLCNKSFNLSYCGHDL